MFFLIRGTEEYLDCKGRVDIINSTLGKALGGAAGKALVLHVIMDVPAVLIR